MYHLVMHGYVYGGIISPGDTRTRENSTKAGLAGGTFDRLPAVRAFPSGHVYGVDGAALHRS